MSRQKAPSPRQKPRWTRPGSSCRREERRADAGASAGGSGRFAGAGRPRKQPRRPCQRTGRFYAGAGRPETLPEPVSRNTLFPRNNWTRTNPSPTAHRRMWMPPEPASAAADAQSEISTGILSLIQEGSRTEDVRRAEATVEQANQGYLTAQSNRAQVNLRRADVDTAQAGIVRTRRRAYSRPKPPSVWPSRACATRPFALPSRSCRRAQDRTGRADRGGQGRHADRGPDSIYFDAQLPEALYTKVTSGKTVIVNISAFPNRAFKGIVNKIFPVASLGTRNFTVRISLLNEGNLLRPQMFARGEIVLDTHPHAVLVPRDAVLDNTGTTGRVFLVKSKTAKERRSNSALPTSKMWKSRRAYRQANRWSRRARRNCRTTLPCKSSAAHKARTPNSSVCNSPYAGELFRSWFACVGVDTSASWRYAEMCISKRQYREKSSK